VELTQVVEVAEQTVTFQLALVVLAAAVMAALQVTP
jgi:hypothetical protein